MGTVPVVGFVSQGTTTRDGALGMAVMGNEESVPCFALPMSGFVSLSQAMIFSLLLFPLSPHPVDVWSCFQLGLNHHTGLFLC